ncbi:asparagine synthase (glutamine-hydrolysing) [Persephonella hydrogeniphila]|uniref:asparagine synthase (glutamine-hydrolyzing) n=1 Tax=Persephonella hydrogeniphila TaxID=198703 RepID=A0A285N9N2_9AQUI|nr:asparagine synthase (glutamine-hydrolyzing) [Persephonella hydrogeniphila]SNZ06175.1 asparagine synthase (glutamine-hydrolysing) [Persephonella hydrogeniphila]
MCGIAGFVDFNKKSDLEVLKNMTDVLYHRGPDDNGYSFYSLSSHNIGLGHRRLSILDLSKHGHQPMKFDNLEIVYNGEVYNFKEIRKELEIYGYKFISNTDTEVILKAFHKWGIEAVHKFIGMFAIAIYDKEKQQLILIRDRVGVKPLYYYYKDGLFLFASELKSFHKHPNFRKNININALALFFRFGYIIQPYSIFQNTWKLKSGHYGILDLKSGNFKEVKYWDVIDFYNKPKLKIDFQEAVEETERLLKSAFKYRMISDVPVGIFLSGGYDSSTVAAILQKNRSDRIKTFTIGFYEDKFNEAHHARKIAKYLGTEHTEYYCTQKEALDIIPKLAYIYDEPFGDPSSIPTILVSRITRKKVKVSLSADGGDEIFGGYKKYTQAMKFFDLLSKIPLKEKLLKILPNMNNKVFLSKKLSSKVYTLKKLLPSKDYIDMMNRLTYYFQPEEIPKFIDTSNNSEIDLSLTCNVDNIIDKMLATDFKTYLVDDILVKVDRATMNTSLEGREPFLDYRLIEFVAQLPSSYKINENDKKILLKSIAHKYIPKDMIDRPKMGFSVPLNEWFQKELSSLLNEYFDLEKLKKVTCINAEEVHKIYSQWLKFPEVNYNKIWILLIFLMWYEEWM